MPKAISYLRFSAMHQGKGSSISRQREMIERWLSENPTYEESSLSKVDHGRSAYDGENLKHGFGSIIKSIEYGDILEGDCILVEAIDRIGRLSYWEMHTLIGKIIAAGVTIITLEDGIEYNKETADSNPTTLMLLTAKISQAHDFSKKLSNRLLAAYRNKRAKALSGVPIRIVNAYWLNKEGLVDQYKGEIVKACIDLYLSGKGTRGIVLELLSKYPELETCHPTTLKRWFANPALIGTWHNKGDPIEGVFEPLIDIVTWSKIQKTLKDRTRKSSPAEKYELSGLVQCDVCKGKFYFSRQPYKDRVIIYANCSTLLKRGSHFCNNNKTWPYPVLMYIYNLTHQTHLADLADLDYDNIREKQISEELLKIEAQISTKSAAKIAFEYVLEECPTSKTALSKVIDQERALELLEKERALLISKTMTDTEKPSLGSFTGDYLKELEDKPEIKRSILQETGYKLTAMGHTIRVATNNGTYEVFDLIKRSTRHKSYFITHKSPIDSMAWPKNEAIDSYEERKLILFSDDRPTISGKADTWEELIGPV
jgi:DNA invertase Pin-like site-specific DNA recombinase